MRREGQLALEGLQLGLQHSGGGGEAREQEGKDENRQASALNGAPLSGAPLTALRAVVEQQDAAAQQVQLECRYCTSGVFSGPVDDALSCYTGQVSELLAHAAAARETLAHTQALLAAPRPPAGVPPRPPRADAGPAAAAATSELDVKPDVAAAPAAKGGARPTRAAARTRPRKAVKAEELSSGTTTMGGGKRAHSAAGTSEGEGAPSEGSAPAPQTRTVRSRHVTSVAPAPSKRRLRSAGGVAAEVVTSPSWTCIRS